ncbi:MAG: ExeM/NucH family extracellular endonuclease, partial [Chloroflexi bacterium]|nr:ExeM/NucH family extracellular endonuclease [Chloroflexota bacterium]
MLSINKLWRLMTIAALLAGALNLGLVPATPARAAGTVSLNGFTAYTQNFDTLSNTAGSTTNVLSITGWDMLETGGGARDNEQYAVDTGAGNTGDTYSYGSAAATDRALGSLRSGTLIPVYGASFTNNTGSAIAALDVSYVGEEWRLGTASRTDQLNFEYSVDATSLSTGTWTPVSALNFVTPDTATTGAKNGNAASSRTSLSTTISSLNIANGSTFWIRWVDADATGADDGLAVDDFSLTPVAAGAALSINDVTLPAEGNSGTSLASFTVSLSSPAPVGGVTFDIATADGTATAGSDYEAKSLTSQTIAAGNTSYTFDVTVYGDTDTELTETFLVNVTNVTGATVSDGQGQGTITNDDAVVPVISISDVSMAEGDSGTKLFTFTTSLNIPVGGDVTFDIATADGTATAGSDYVAKNLSSQAITAGNTSYTFDVTVNGDYANEANETFFVNLTNVTGVTVADGQGQGTILNDDAAITPIYSIQGTTDITPLPGVQTTLGVVVGDYEGASPALGGFYIQDPTGDGNPATSDGLYIYNGSNNSVNLGDLVRVTGTVAEYQGQTQIGTVTNITVLSTGNTITPTDISLPFASTAAEEQYEGMLVRVPQTLYVTEHYLLGRFGQVTLSGTAKLAQPTNVVLPGAPALALQAANDLNQIIVDDSSQAQNPDPIVFGRGGLPLSASNTLRGGDTITNLTGIFNYTWGGNSASPNAYRIRPINAMGGGSPNFVASNARPTSAPSVGGNLKVVGMNLLNYFNTFGVGACTYGVGGAATDCRGADNATEFTRQSDKTVAAILTMDADVIGIVEMENDGYDSSSAIQDLVTKLNAAAGAGTYAFINPDTTNGVNSLGTDAIKVGILYKPASVTPVGTTATLNTVAFINAGDSAARNRTSLLQAFKLPNGETFLFNVNHLKSKGSACDDPDAGDGQGNCNIVRTIAVGELLNWFNTDPTGTNDPDILVVGDMNSYAKEDPIAAFEAGGFTNMVAHFGGPNAYSYVFDGQWGYLDYALGSASLLAQTNDVEDWHINSDEPSVLDYNTDYKTAGQIVSLYNADQFRISDHDPVVTGLNLQPVAKPVLTVTASSATITYGDAAPSITPSYSGFVDGDTAAVLDTAPTCSA